MNTVWEERCGGCYLIEVNHGLQQGCMMLPLCLTYVCVMAERWLDRIQDKEDVGTCVLYKLDQQLFHGSTRNACERGSLQMI